MDMMLQKVEIDGLKTASEGECLESAKKRTKRGFEISTDHFTKYGGISSHIIWCLTTRCTSGNLLAIFNLCKKRAQIKQTL